MLNAEFTAAHVGLIICPGCKRSPGGTLKVVSQALVPNPINSDISVRLSFACATCRGVRTFERVFPRAALLRLIDKYLVDNGVCWEFLEPVEIELGPTPIPSIGPETPDRPVSEADLKAARQLLARTSFKRTSKGWREFLRRIKQEPR